MKNQLKIIFTVNEKRSTELDNLKNKLQEDQFTQNVFTGQFEPLDKTKVIITNPPILHLKL